MSLKKDDSNSHDQTAAVQHDLRKKPKFSYTRDFLLSLSDLDVCKKLPSGFDQSIMAEFEEASYDRQRVSGALSLNSFRRNEYGSSPPSRAETSNYSRRIHGKREIHSSGRSDKDSDSQSDRDSVDSGWRYGDQSRRPSQGPEHDGLLGSGSFPRPSGYVPAFLAPKVRANDQYQLNRSNEPYHPPRPYKAVAHQRGNTNDSYNHETFGSSEYTSEDRVEEEKKRRASFESMRKEQHKAFQESHKSNPVKQRDEFAILMELDESKDDEKSLNTISGVDESISLKQTSKNDREKSFTSQSTVSRPLVPPGFTSTVLEKNFATRSSVNPHLLEGKDDIDKCLQTKEEQLHNGIAEDLEGKSSSEQMGRAEQYRKTSINVSTNNTGEKILDLFSAVDMSNKTTEIDNQSHKKSLEVFEASDNSTVVDCKTEKLPANTAIGEPSQVHSSSILEKLFGSAMKLDGDATNFIEVLVNVKIHPFLSWYKFSGFESKSTSYLWYYYDKHDNEMDDVCSPQNAQSSKFAHWFMDSDRKQEDDLSPKRSIDLLTMIVGGEKGGYDVADVKHSEQSLPTVAFHGYESAENYITSSSTSSNVAKPEPFYNKSKPEAVSAILTCEAVEQTLLSKVSENDSALHPSDQRCSHPVADVKHPSVKSDDHASQHLLSLLQKGSSPLISEYGDDGGYMGPVFHNNEESTHNISNPGKTLTLETLFGSAFMKELQSVGAPVSAQRGSSGSVKSDASESHGPITDDGPLSNNEVRSSMLNHDHGDQRQQNQPDIVRGNWLNLNGPRPESDSSHPLAKLGHKIGGPAEMPFPEEDSLIISDSMNFQNLISMGNSAKPQPLFSHNTQDNNAMLSPAFKDERQSIGGVDGLPFSANPYDRRETEMPHRKAPVHSAFSQLHPPQTNNVKLFHQFEPRPPNMNSQGDLMLPEGIVHHDSPSNHQFVANMLRPPTSGLSGFDHSIHHPMLQQMQTSVNLPPQHLLQGLSRGVAPPMSNRNLPLHPHSARGSAAPSQPNHQVTGLPQELNSIQGFHIGQRVPNIGGPRLPSPAPGNQPDAIQRLIQMGHRSNSKQIHPLSASGGHGQGMYGHELNMGYGYR
ncbi:uncharacterized protein LOC120073406 isoform X2 [Benincasa hispida]|uniref:uncharacterized protein LOC120073406 isoform X2 n=1 Tax=Benincasa hispida TaxID=102211 RepID=UPI0018FFA1D1|nr:uncharacterized protein LOC120073406 isoform X2 [Benincasa hispida]